MGTSGAGSEPGILRSDSVEKKLEQIFLACGEKVVIEFDSKKFHIWTEGPTKGGAIRRFKSKEMKTIVKYFPIKIEISSIMG